MPAVKTLAALPALALLAASTSALADAVDGTVLAHDRVANILVLSDKTVWTLANLEAPLPDGLAAGDRVEISYESNEDDGLKLIHSVKRLP